MSKNKLQIEQLSTRLKELSVLQHAKLPASGWINAIRTTIGMSLVQLGNKLKITRQSAHEIEIREKEGSITLKALQEAARAMDMQLVYGLVPVDASLEAMIDKKARELARKIVLRTSNSMALEDQGNSEDRLKKAIDERTEELKREMPKLLWD